MLIDDKLLFHLRSGSVIGKVLKDHLGIWSRSMIFSRRFYWQQLKKTGKVASFPIVNFQLSVVRLIVQQFKTSCFFRCRYEPWLNGQFQGFHDLFLFFSLVIKRKGNSKSLSWEFCGGSFSTCRNCIPFNTSWKSVNYSVKSLKKNQK